MLSELIQRVKIIAKEEGQKIKGQTPTAITAKLNDIPNMEKFLGKFPLRSSESEL